MITDLKKLEHLAERELVQWLTGYVDALRDQEDFSPMQFHALDERLAFFLGAIDQLRKLKAERDQDNQNRQNSMFDEEDSLPF
jgi:ribulose 1,5-bisphosphate carboxylase large subunit-like protein